MQNLALVHAYLERGCSQAGDEVSIQWKPINFMIYSEMFPDMIMEAVREWLATFDMKPETDYEIIFGHVIDRDAGGAVLGEWFSPMSLKEEQHND